MLATLDAAMLQAVVAMRKWPTDAVRLYHHNDADGLSSGAILTRALNRAGYRVERGCLEKPYPPVLETIYREAGRIIVFADFAGRIAPLLSKLNRGRNLTLILDHHPAMPSKDPSVLNLDPDLFGFRGDRDVSASTVCFRFAVILDPVNRDLAHLAVAGAVGDGFFEEGRLVGLNLAADLDLLGGVGYFQGGPETGIRVCLEGYDAAAHLLRENVVRQRQTLYRAEIEALRAGTIKSTGQVQWFSVADRFNGIGVKTIGAFCRAIRRQDFIDPEKYIAGFQPVPDTVPGLGRIDFDAVKVSMRVPPALETRILRGERPGLDWLLPEATRVVGGFSDACHSLAAATTVPPGSEAQLVEAMNTLLQMRTARGA